MGIRNREREKRERGERMRGEKREIKRKSENDGEEGRESKDCI